MPRAYYNEIDPYCADWLRNLMRDNLIAPGDVDERPIQDVRPSDLHGYTQCHFFAGLGGWSYALREAAWPDHRQVWTGSCPCQPFSAAGKRGGFADERHLWPTWQYLIEQRRPPIVFGEQVASAAEWLRLVRGDLEALGYAVGCCPVEAASAGADHLRDRYWFVAHAHAHAHVTRSQGQFFLSERPDQRTAGPDGMANPHFLERRIGDIEPARQFPQQQHSEACDGNTLANTGYRAGRTRNVRINSGAQTAGKENNCAAEYGFEWVIGADGKVRRVKPGIRLLAHGVPNRIPQLCALGNAIDHRPAKAFIQAAVQALNI